MHEPSKFEKWSNRPNVKALETHEKERREAEKALKDLEKTLKKPTLWTRLYVWAALKYLDFLSRR